MQNGNRSAMLGQLNMERLVPKVSIPIMISMLVQALYNVVDSIFVSRYDPNALTGVSLAYPVQMLMIALSVGMGVGINSLISRKLGAGDAEGARRTAWNGILIEGCGTLLFLFVGLVLAEPLLGLLTRDSLRNAEEIRRLGTAYLRIVTTFSLGLFMAVCFERMLQSTGNTRLSMITQLCGALTNIVLDPILIFGYFGCPEMGVVGAAAATVIGQWCAMTVGLILNQLRNKELFLRLSEFRPSGTVLRGIFAVGLPSTVMQAIGSVMNVGMNGILSSFPGTGNEAVNVLNIYYKLQSFVFMPVFGLGSGIIAIVGYNFGARLMHRVHECIRVALRWVLIIMAAGTLIFLFFPGALMSLFESGEAGALSGIGIVAMRIICLHFMIAGVSITLTNVFQAVGKGIYSLIISLCRQLFVLLPVAWALSRISLEAVWWAFLIAEGVSVTMCVLLFRRLDRTMLRERAPRD